MCLIKLFFLLLIFIIKFNINLGVDYSNLSEDESADVSNNLSTTIIDGETTTQIVDENITTTIKENYEENLISTEFKEKLTETITSTTESDTVERNLICEVKNLTIEGINPKKTEFTIKLNIDGNITTNCNLLLNCTSSNNQESTEKIISVSNEITTTLSNLTQSTTYYCDIELDKTLITNFEVTTLEEVPSDISFFVTDVTSDSFLINWIKPEGNINNYYIKIKNNGPKHFVREECLLEIEENEMILSFQTESEEISYEISNLTSNYEYEIQVIAENNEGNSTGITENITTTASISSPPINVTSTVLTNSDHCNGNDYNASILIEWEYPCDTKGELDYFQIEVKGYLYKNKRKNPSELYNEIFKISKNDTELYYQWYITNLNAAFLYNFTIIPVTEHNNYGESIDISNITKDGCPSPPENLRMFQLFTDTYQVKWDEPSDYFGDILWYKVKINTLKPNHYISSDEECSTTKQNKIEEIEITTNSYMNFPNLLPDFSYMLTVEGYTSTGYSYNSKNVTTDPKEPEEIRNLIISPGSITRTDKEYLYTIQINFKEPCNTNDNFQFYEIIGRGTRIGYPDVVYNKSIDKIDETKVIINVTTPSYDYNFNIRVRTNHFNSPTVTKSITTSCGIPSINMNGFNYKINENKQTEIDIVLNKNITNNDMGKILYYCVIIVRLSDVLPKINYTSYDFWDGQSWPIANETLNINEKPLQIIQYTPNKWNPFKNGQEKIQISIGDKLNCTLYQCESLIEETNYLIVIRSLTKESYSDVYFLTKTGTIPSHFGLYLLIIFIVIIIAIIIILPTFYILKKNKLWIFSHVSTITLIEDLPPARYTVMVKNFVSYYNKISNDLILLKNQYDEIEDEIKIYKENYVNTTFALKPENKRKNRYTNILPYDEFRVKLNIDEDDEISSDYINASYIKGYSGKTEYIATQGPLEHTCKDFWKMVIQENVNVIIMVSQFIEKEKEKCFKYFPNNHETMLISDEIEIKCLTELQFDTYIIRTLLIRKDVNKYTVIHMQYIEWPDFGCPKGTNNMISFCQEVRDRIQLEKGLLLVHCSAGVGRTGTLISLDILLQMIRKRKEISIFETVMELRKQRTNMVQTEKQYIYIHTCINDTLSNKSLYVFDDVKEHTYENIKKINQKEEEESRF